MVTIGRLARVFQLLLCLAHGTNGLLQYASGLSLQSYGFHRFGFGRTHTACSNLPNSSFCFSNRGSTLMRMSNADYDYDLDAGDRVENEYAKGLLVLASVPMAWGTFEPAVRLVYKYEPMMPPLVFSFAYYMVATLFLTIGMVFAPSMGSEHLCPEISERTSHGSPSKASTQIEPDRTKIEIPSSSWDQSSIYGGIELGTYLFVGNTLQVIGLKSVPSDRAAILLQLTTLFVPLLKSLTAKLSSEDSSRDVSKSTWLACLIALAGVCLVGLDHPVSSNPTISETGSPLSLLAFSIDDLCIVLGALFYTFHCLRLETYARSPDVSALRLAASKAATELTWSGLSIALCLGLAATAAFAVSGNEVHGMIDISRESIPSFQKELEGSGVQISGYLQTVWESFQTLPPSTFQDHWATVGLATLWTGAITVAYTIYAQSYGQSKVPAVVANLVYSSQPIFTAIVAYLVLGELTLGVQGYFGGLLIGGAVLLVVLADDYDNNNDRDGQPEGKVYTTVTDEN